MEYEICGEERLFDDSTNPSLDHADEQRARLKGRNGKPVKRDPQKAVTIPEEEHQLA